MKLVLLTILIVPGLACLYALVLRPALQRIPAFKSFYADADGFWAKVWALCGNSLTIMWSYVLAGLTSSMQVLDWVSIALGDPELNLKQKIMDGLSAHPEYAAYAAMAISAITIITRLRSIIGTS